MLGLRPLHSSVAVIFAVAAVTFTHVARADLLPPNDCTDPESPDASPRSLGQSCTTAGPDFDQDGVCVNGTYTCGGGPGREAGTCAAVLCELVDAGSSKVDATAPTNSCPESAAAGTACNNGGPNFDQAGTCQPAHCDCNVCVVSDAGSPAKDAGHVTTDAGKPAVDAGRSTTKDAGQSTPSKDATASHDAGSTLDSSSGCSVSSTRSGWDGAWFLGLGALGLMVSRSRSRARRA